MKCSVDSCVNDAFCKGWCTKHYQRFQKYGDPLKLKNRPKGQGSISVLGYLRILKDGDRTAEHIKIARKALGHQLPKGAVVHHADGDSSNNANSNLVICPSQAYHILLHCRLAAFHACGNPNFLKCQFCGVWESPENMITYGGNASPRHRLCQNKYQRMAWRRRTGRKSRIVDAAIDKQNAETT